jgi:DNA-binding response OmpR family regulator
LGRDGPSNKDLTSATLKAVAATPRNIQVRTIEFRESTILVVDDEASSRDLMSTLLTTQGYKVKTASDGFEALQVIDAGGVDLVLLDLMMSKLDGVEVCTHIRKSAKNMLLPVVFTTSLHDRASRIRAKEAGGDDFLVKPIDGLELLVRIERLLRLRAQTELVYAERDRLLKELSKVRASLSALGTEAGPGPVVIAGAALSTEELVREQRRLLGDVLRSDSCARSDELRTRLEEILRVVEEVERRVTAPSTAFPLGRTRSTV